MERTAADLPSTFVSARSVRLAIELDRLLGDLAVVVQRLADNLVGGSEAVATADELRRDKLGVELEGYTSTAS